MKDVDIFTKYLTKREHFAAIALVGMNVGYFGYGKADDIAKIAQKAFMVADAMISEAEKEKPLAS